MSPVSVRRGAARVGAVAAAAVIAVGLSTIAAVPASAATAGYVRLAHLSPDTPNVDVYLSSVSGAIKPQTFRGVGYGIMSDYLRLPTGAYAVAMRAAGAPATDQPVLTTQVTVGSGHAYTVAGVGKHADLGLRVIDDDLSLPPSGKAKVRILQASVRAPVLTVSTAGGETIASDVSFASTTSYEQTSPGKWTLQVQPAGSAKQSVVTATLGAGNVYSLLVLDSPNGGLTGQLRIDARRQGGVPLGAVDTGAGGTAQRNTTPVLIGAAVAVLLGGGLVTAWLFTVRRRRLRPQRL